MSTDLCTYNWIKQWDQLPFDLLSCVLKALAPRLSFNYEFRGKRRQPTKNKTGFIFEKLFCFHFWHFFSWLFSLKKVFGICLEADNKQTNTETNKLESTETNKQTNTHRNKRWTVDELAVDELTLDQLTSFRNKQTNTSRQTHTRTQTNKQEKKKNHAQPLKKQRQSFQNP